MAKVCIICGDTGTGKSTSLKNLDPKETFIINCLNKPLPFKGSSSVYNTDNKNIFVSDDWSKIDSSIAKIAEQTNIKTLIIDDIGFISTSEFFKRAGETGYNKFTDIGVHMQGIINKCKNLREDLAVFLMFHEDDETSDKIKVGKKVKLIGAMLDDKYSPLAIVSVALFTNVTFDKDGKAEYSFTTQRTMQRGIVTPAKSPEGMFEAINIPNDLSIVREKMFEYYK